MALVHWQRNRGVCECDERQFWATYKSKIDSFQNANFLISQPNHMILPLIGIVSERRFQ